MKYDRSTSRLSWCIRTYFAHQIINMEKNKNQPLHRRIFFKQSTGLAFTALGISSMKINVNYPSHSAASFQKKPALPAELVYDFVRMAHTDLNKVKEMLLIEPGLVNATWDWGGGDFETALGGASHMGNRAIVSHLLQHGARKDIYTSAVLGEVEVIKALVAADPSVVNVPGPHGLSLLYHVAIGGSVEMASGVKPHLKNLAGECNRSMQVAAREGHLPMTKWLLSNGVNDPNLPDFSGNTPLQIAEKRGYTSVAEYIKGHGGK
jgi:hypothetical protein